MILNLVDNSKFLSRLLSRVNDHLDYMLSIRQGQLLSNSIEYFGNPKQKVSKLDKVTCNHHIY